MSEITLKTLSEHLNVSERLIKKVFVEMGIQLLMDNAQKLQFAEHWDSGRIKDYYLSKKSSDQIVINVKHLKAAWDDMVSETHAETQKKEQQQQENLPF